MNSLKEIASHLNISVASVSNAFSGKGRLSPKLKEKILQTAAELGYRPSQHAQALHGRKLQIIGILIASMHDGVSQEIIDGVEQVATAEGYRVLLALTRDEQSKANEAILSFKQLNLAGVVHLPSANISTAEILKLLEGTATPHIALYRRAQNDPSPGALVDHRAGFQAGLEYLLNRQHQTIAYLYSKTYKGPEVATAKQTFREFAKQHNCRCPIVAFSEANLIKTIKEKNITALFCDSDNLAKQALDCLHAAKMKVPRDVSILGFRDTDTTRMTSPKLSSIQVPYNQIGQEGAKLLFNRLKQPQETADSPQTVMLTPQLVIRQSTAKAALQSAITHLK